MTDLLHRGDFDTYLTGLFPRARRTREESSRGWSDSFRIGFLEVRVTVCDSTTKPAGKRALGFGEMRAEIHAVRTRLDNSTVEVWSRRGRAREGEAVLADLHQTLLGLAHGIVHVANERGSARLKPKSGQVPLEDRLR